MISIVISGPESTGKSTLSIELAKAFNGVSIPEYARDYVERLDRQCGESDIETIAHRQLAIYKKNQRQYRSVDCMIFFDTFLVITKIWFQEVYQYCPVWLNNAIANNRPDLVLLCRPDIKWQADGIRENEKRREYLYDCYAREFDFYQIPWMAIEGRGDSRTFLAIELINKHIKSTKL